MVEDIVLGWLNMGICFQHNSLPVTFHSDSDSTGGRDLTGEEHAEA